MKTYTSEEIYNIRSEVLKESFRHLCIDSLCISGDLEDIKYLVEYRSYLFDNYTPIISDNHKIEVVSYLYNALDRKINWKKFLVRMCAFNHKSDIVNYLIDRSNDSDYKFYNVKSYKC